jgi:uncharacterized protein YciI
VPTYLAISEYVVDREQVAPVVPAHREWILAHYDSGVMLASGPLTTSPGGALIFVAGDLTAALDLLAADPLALEEVARYTVHELNATDFPWRNSHFDAFEAAARTGPGTTE